MLIAAIESAHQEPQSTAMACRLVMLKELLGPWGDQVSSYVTNLLNHLGDPVS